MKEPIVNNGVNAIAEIFNVGKFGQDPKVAQTQLKLIRMAVERFTMVGTPMAMLTDFMTSMVRELPLTRTIMSAIEDC